MPCDAATLAPDALHKIRDGDFVRASMATLEATYAALDLGPFTPERFERYLSTVTGFARNRYVALGRNERARVLHEVMSDRRRAARRRSMPWMTTRD